MKTLFLGIIFTGITLLSFGSAFALNLEEWVEALGGRTPDEILDTIDKNSRNWPKLDALSNTDELDRSEVRQLTELVLKALKLEANSIENSTSHRSITERTERAMRLARVAKAAGGYLNDLISVSGENVAIIGSWIALDRWPESAAEIKEAVYRDSKKEPLRAKEWFEFRFELDAWLSERKERLAQVKDETPGFQAGNHLGYERPYHNNQMPTVFDLIENPDLNVMWWEVFYNDYNLSATIPAACDYLIKGGELFPVPKHMPNAVTAVFGDEGIPYEHQLRSGKISAEDLWRGLRLATVERSRQIKIRNWFGE